MKDMIRWENEHFDDMGTLSEKEKSRSSIGTSVVVIVKLKPITMK